MFRYSVRLTSDEVRRFLRETAHRSKHDHIAFWLLLLLPVAVIVADILRDRFGGGTGVNPWLWAAAGGCWGLLWFLGPGGRWYRVQKLMRTPLATHPLAFEFSEEGLKLVSADTELRTKWSGILDIEETDELLLFRTAERMWFVLPWRVVPDAERDDLTEFVRERVNVEK